MPRLSGKLVIDVIVTHSAADNQPAIRKPVDGLARQLDIMVEHNGVGVFDPAGQVVLVMTVQRRHVGQIAENLFFRRKTHRR